jgi:hypothetical protein
MVAGLATSNAHSNPIQVRGSEIVTCASGSIPLSVSTARPVAVMPRMVSESTPHSSNLPASDLRMGQSQRVGVQSPLAGWMGTSGNRRVPVKILTPMQPRIAR